MAARPDERARSEHTTRAQARGSGKGGFVLLLWSASARRLPLPSAGSAVLGRGAGADLRVDDESLSRLHARFTVGETVTVEDLGSRNGTRVHGRKLESHVPVELPVGSIAELGDVVVALQWSGDGPSDEPRAPAAAAALAGAVIVDPVMKGLYQLLDVVAPSDASVLLLGETGTGKEVFAREIHARSHRRSGALLTLNCAALPESMLEAELFGFERGAFTGASHAKPGLFESAEGSTLFLDEIGELPLTTQAKLLRFLESGETLRLGSLRPRRIDVRIVSATNRDLAVEIARKAFRSDLFFRLNGISVTIPALRERRSEIAALAEAFVAHAAAKAKRRAPPFSSEARAALVAYDWPGNVRELKNVVERAVLLLGARAEITSADLDLRALSPSPEGRSTSGASLREEVEGVERQRIVEALAATGGNQSAAARRLGIPRGTLLVKLDQFGIGRPRKNR